MLITTNKKPDEYYALEYLKCRQNPLYFIYNYVKIPEIGGSIALSSDTMHVKMKRTIRSLIRHRKVMLMASRQLGKALYIETLIPMANGTFKKIKYLKVGDIILDENSNPTKIIATTKIMYDRPCYDVYFSNGEIITADANHLWRVNNELKTTEELSNSPVVYSVTMPNNSLVQITNIQQIKSVPVKCIQVDNKDGMFLCGQSGIPTHNSTIASAILTWAINFYPGIPCIILNMRQVAALENLNKIKFMHSNLPSWMKSPLKGRAEKKTYLELENNSIVRTFYPASTAGPDQIARSLTAPILYIDEVAFIRHIALAYRAAQPVLG